jgi:hypothetical protein
MKTKSTETEAVFSTLNASTQAQRDAYVARAEEIYMAGLRRMRENLAAAGMDLNKVAPSPKSTMGRKEYRMALALHHRYTASFVTMPECQHQNVMGMLNGKIPWLVVEKPDAEAKVRAAARSDAKSCFDSFLYKLAGKITEAKGPNDYIWGATLQGVIWDGCTLTVTRSLRTGTQFDPLPDFVFTTRCIINQSVYGKLFNQWPTRRQA